MDLKLKVADVVIDMGFICNVGDKVCLRFRRFPDSDVALAILSLEERYGWSVSQYSRELQKTEYQLYGDFCVRCTGVFSDEVGMAIGERLEVDHGLNIKYQQFVNIGPDKSEHKFVEKLDLLK